MTSAGILAMPAGRDLDGLIDELVFGIDRTANTPEKIRSAVSAGCIVSDRWELGTDNVTTDFRIDGIEYRAVYDPNGPWEIPETKSFLSGWVWFQRHGKPYAAALERLVANWRAEPSQKYSTDWRAAGPLLELLLNIGAIFENGGNAMEPFLIHGWRGDQNVIASANTAPLAIARAAAILLRKTEDLR